MNANVVLVTGGGRGIGAAVCLKAALQGFDIAINYQYDTSAAERIASAIRVKGQRAICVQADVSDYEQVKGMFKRVDKELGSLYGLVNNAGITGLGSTLETVSADTLEKVVKVNVLGTMYCTKEALRYMSNGGAIVNVSSGAATLGSANEFTWYAASKAAVDTFTYGIAQEVASKSIRVNAVSPGLTETELHAKSTGDPGRVQRLSEMIPMKRSASPDEVADPIMYLLQRQGNSYITGANLRVAGGR